MKVCLIVIGECVFSWVVQGFVEYQKWLLYWLLFELVEIEFGLCGKGCDLCCVIEDEGKWVIVVLLKNVYVVVLDVLGWQLSFEQLVQCLEYWCGQGWDLVFLIGGLEGYLLEVFVLVDEKWLIGLLMLLYMLVCLVVVEQLYWVVVMIVNYFYYCV